ncbi:dehydrodolichyl diphosphate syntase complex subunit DHDDS-like protein [Dinothrombium tinctorium]|uniref:Alkyl transferase n=1 Tax=Dinothrombium tinctorium TaxID=1965070 RepID=A0A443RIZ4_9ACAR|nr:dehydrodolichyl diphosphate syntase complex subunit DHDDS-like protein [Dinothrombium tinctorium]
MTNDFLNYDLPFLFDFGPSILQRFAINVLSSCVLPKHVAIILDGNRRWARQCGLPIIEVHKRLVKKLAEAFSWTRYFKIPEITVYIFSIENLKRSREEVYDLMKIYLNLFKKMLHESEFFHENGVRVRFFGNFDLMPPELRSCAEKIELATKNNSRVTINFAFFYTSTDEITFATEKLREDVKQDHLKTSDIDEFLFEKCLFTGDGHCPE